MGLRPCGRAFGCGPWRGVEAEGFGALGAVAGLHIGENDAGAELDESHLAGYVLHGLSPDAG